VGLKESFVLKKNSLGGLRNLGCTAVLCRARSGAFLHTLAQLHSLKLFPVPRTVFCGVKPQFLYTSGKWFPVLLRLDEAEMLTF